MDYLNTIYGFEAAALKICDMSKRQSLCTKSERTQSAYVAVWDAVSSAEICRRPAWPGRTTKCQERNWNVRRDDQGRTSYQEVERRSSLHEGTQSVLQDLRLPSVLQAQRHGLLSFLHSYLQGRKRDVRGRTVQPILHRHRQS